MPRATRRRIVALVPALVAGGAAVALSARVDAFALRLLLQAVTAAALATAAWRAAVIGEPHDGDAADAPARPPAEIERIAGDRRRPTIDRDTGLLADWYFRLRVEEELARAARYDQRFTLLRLSGGGAGHAGLARAMRVSLRAIDLAGTVADATWVLLPNTRRDAAEPVIARLRALAPEHAITAVECPTEASTIAAILGEEQWTSSQPSWPEAPAA